MDLTAFDRLLTQRGQELLAELAAGPEPADRLAAATRLRARHPAELVAAALTQDRLRRRAAAKFGAGAAAMYFTEAGYEQSTRRAVARLRAERYIAAGVRRVADLCCGIGGDALAFAEAGLEVLALDRDPLTIAVLRANAAALGLADRIEAVCADVTRVDLDGCDAVFLDPARRAERGRVFDPAAYAPPWDFAVGLAGRVPAAGFKVAPGIPHDAVPAEAEAAWVSDGGEVKEAGIYFGPLRTAARRATLLPGPHSLAADTDPDDPAAPRDPEPGEIGRFLYEPDGAVIRARLLGDLAGLLGARSLDPTIAYLTADQLVETPFATAYEITDVLPFHVKKLRALVAERGYGTLAIKKRGADVDPEALRRQLKPSGPKTSAATLVVTRHLGRHVALVAREPATPRPPTAP